MTASEDLSTGDVPKTRGGWVPVGTSAARRATHQERGNARGERTRRSILDAARRVFEEKGYFDVGVEDIVKEAGVARGSFYTYFPAKKDVFRELSAEVGVEIDQAVAQRMLASVDLVQSLRDSNQRYVDAYRANAIMYGLIEQVASVDPEVHAHRLQRRQRHIRRVANSIRRWQKRGLADPDVDPGVTAAALVSMTSNFCYWWFVGPEPHDEERALATLNEMWIRAVGLRSGASAPGGDE